MVIGIQPDHVLEVANEVVDCPPDGLRAWLANTPVLLVLSDVARPLPRRVRLEAEQELPCVYSCAWLSTQRLGGDLEVRVGRQRQHAGQAHHGLEKVLPNHKHAMRGDSVG